MLGDRLTCVWQTIFAQTTAKKEDIHFAQELKKITEYLLQATGKPFSAKRFSTIVKHDFVSFQDFKLFIMEQLGDDDVPDHLKIIKIEEECWTLSKVYYTSNLTETALKKLWQITNCLTLAKSYPPIICKEEIGLMLGKVVEYVDNPDKAKTALHADATFPELLSHLEVKMFKGCSQEKINECIDDLHCWLVLKVYRTGWVHTRTKTGPNWTNWIKKWVVLLPGRLIFYEKESLNLDTQPDSEIIINEASKVLPQGPYKSTGIKLDGRFKVLNPPLSEYYIATNDQREADTWLTQIKRQIQTGESPVQTLLRERCRIREELEHKTEKNSNQLRNYLRKSKCARRPESKNEKDETEAKEAKLKSLFMKLGPDGNGFIDRRELYKYIKTLGLNMTEKDKNLVFHQIDKNTNGVIDFNELRFENFSRQILDENGTDKSFNAVGEAVVADNLSGPGKINFCEFSEYMLGQKANIRMNNLLKTFREMEASGNAEGPFSEFNNLLEKQRTGVVKIAVDNMKIKSSSTVSSFAKRPQKTYKETEPDYLPRFLNGRRNKFAAFKRQGSSGSLVMTGKDEMVSEILPGNYNLVDLVCFSDLPPLEPRHTVIKGVQWISSKVPGESGRATFPTSFDGQIATESATNEHLMYYGASFAENRQLQVSLCYRHGIQDFTYENSYLEDYAKVRGCGIETHSFVHLNCPLGQNSGVFVIGKLLGEELHLTAFKVPTRHTVYVPAYTIHSNDYLIGTWRTMLSDEAIIDHVLTVWEKEDAGKVTYENIQLSFQ